MQARACEGEGKLRRKKLIIIFDHFYVERSHPSPARAKVRSTSPTGGEVKGHEGEFRLFYKNATPTVI